MKQATKLFVGRLPPACKKSDIEEMFSKYGTVKECDILTTYGFVHMGSSEEAEAAIKALHNTEIYGAKITVEESTSRPRSNMFRARGGGRGRRPVFRNCYDSQGRYLSASWERYGGRMHPYPEIYDDRWSVATPPAYSCTGYNCFYSALPSDDESADVSRYSFDSMYNQYDPYGGPPSWSNFSGSRPSPPLPRRTEQCVPDTNS